MAQICQTCSLEHFYLHQIVILQRFTTNHENLITGAPALGDSVRLGVTKPDGGFNEVLSKIHSNNYKSNLADKLSRR